MSRQSSATRNAWRVPAAVAIALVLGAALAVWPTLIVASTIVGFVVILALRAPEYAFLISILLFATEGLLKAWLAHEGTPLTVSTNAVGALLLDLCLVASFVALVRRDSRHRLEQVWHSFTTWPRVALALLALWIAISIVQVLAIGSLDQGVHGFRLVQAYAVMGVLGALLLDRLPQRTLVPLLLSGLLVISGYAVFRVITGPSAVERAYNVGRAGIETYGGVGRAAGSFSAAAGLASFLVPAAVFGFVLALTLPRYRLLATAVFVFAVVGIIGSYVRVGVVALALGLLLGAGLLVAQTGWSNRRRLAVLGVISLAFAVGGIGTAIASRASPDLRERASAFVHPLRDESVQLRLTTWRLTFEEVRRHPLGTGVGSVGRASEYGGGAKTIADNSYLKVLREQGWIGGLMFSTGLIVLLVALALGLNDRSQPFQPVAAASLAGAFAFLALGLAGEYVEQPGKVLGWLFLGLAVVEAGRIRSPEGA